MADNEIELEIGQAGGAGEYLVRVVRATGGGEPMGTVRLDVEELIARRGQLEDSVLATAALARRRPEEEEPLRRIGQQLFEALFTGPVAGVYRASLAVAKERAKRLRVVLRLTAPELAVLPWEALWDPELEAYVCRREPLVRHIPAPYTPEPMAVSPPLRILGLIASPRGLSALDAEAEQGRLDAALSGQVRAGQVLVDWLADASWHSVQDRLLTGRWHIVHFIGHGDYDPDRDEGQVALVGEGGRADWVGAGRLADLLDQAEPTPRLVVLNSCSSGESGTRDVFSGTAATLVRSGISAVAAMQFSISDRAALAFPRGFYTALAAGRTVDDAVQSGRIAILGLPHSLEWVTPVLYVRGATTQLFTLTPSSTDAVANLEGDGQVDSDLGQVDTSRLDKSAPRDARADPSKDPRYIDALSAFFGNRWAEAVAGFEDVQTRYPDDLRLQGRLQDARRQRDLTSWSAKADTAMGQGDWATAVASLEQIVAIDTSYHDASGRLEHARTAQKRQSLLDEIAVLHHAQQWQAVIAVGEELARIDPEQPDPDGMVAEARKHLADEDIAGRFAEGLRFLDEGKNESAAALFAAIEEERPGYESTTSLLAVARGSAPTRIVAKSGGHHTTIAAAIAASEKGDRIVIKPGEYEQQLVIDKDLDICGDGPIEEIVLTSSNAPVVSIDSSGVQISNITIRQTGMGTQQRLHGAVLLDPRGAEPIRGTLEIQGGQPTITGCDISSGAVYGIVIRGSAQTTVRANCIHDNKRAGVYVLEHGQGTLEDNDIFANAESGVRVASDGDSTVRANRIHDNKGAGVYVLEHGQGTLEDNDIFANAESGVRVASGGDPTVRGNRIRDNQGNGIIVVHKGQGTFKNNDIASNTPSGVLVTVGADPKFDGNHIHHNNEAGIHVYDGGRGTFDNNNISTNTGPGVLVTSGGDPMMRANRIHENKQIGVCVSEQGRGTFEDNDVSENEPSGLRVTTGGAPFVRANRIHENKQIGVCVSEQGRGTFEENDIAANTLLGVLVDLDADPTFESNRIHHNASHGVSVTGGYGTLEYNDISFNGASGVALLSGGNATVRANRVHDNKAAGTWVAEARGTIDDNDIYGNAGPGIQVKSGSAILQTNRIHHNRASGVVVSWKGEATISGNDIYLNAPTNLKLSFAAKVTKRNNQID